MSRSADGRTDRERGDAPSPAIRPQFHLAAIFWILTALGLYLAFLRNEGAQTVLFGAFALLGGALWGLVCGALVRRFVEPMYWATLCAAFAYVSVAREPAFDHTFQFAWATVGAVAGGLAGMPQHSRPLLRMLLGGVAGGLVMGGYVLFASGGPREKMFDALCAPVVGALVGLLIAALRYVEVDRRLPRYTIATWLLCAVLLGNLLSEYLLG
jgi:hypothetical protein